MEIKTASRELTNKELYYLTKASNIQKMRGLVGSTIDVDAFVIYTDVNSNGEEQEILSLRTPEGETFATNSRTFIRTFYDILACFPPEDVKRIEVCEGTSKSGRNFIMAVYAD